LTFSDAKTLIWQCSLAFLALCFVLCIKIHNLPVTLKFGDVGVNLVKLLGIGFGGIR